MGSRARVPHGFATAGAASASDSDDSIEAPAPPAPTDPDPEWQMELSALRGSYQHLSGTPAFQGRFARCVECGDITYYGTPCGLATLVHGQGAGTEGWASVYMGRARATAKYLAGAVPWEATLAEARKFTHG